MTGAEQLISLVEDRGGELTVVDHDRLFCRPVTCLDEDMRRALIALKVPIITELRRRELAVVLDRLLRPAGALRIATSPTAE